MTESVQIERGIPVPAGRMRRFKAMPWDKMEVGESILIANANAHGYSSNANRLYAPKRFTQKKVDGGIRVWRTA